MQLQIVEKRGRMSRQECIRYQLITHCFISKICVSVSDIDLLVLLSGSGQVELKEFCEVACREKIFASQQTVRNSLNRAFKKQLIIKAGKNKKLISIHPQLHMQSDGNILLDYKFLSSEP
jgi:hypothetical protein